MMDLKWHLAKCIEERHVNWTGAVLDSLYTDPARRYHNLHHIEWCLKALAEMALPDPPQPAFKKVDPADDIEFTEAAAAPRRPVFDPPSAESPVAPQQILSRSTVSAVESAFNSLAHTVLSNNARTLEDLVKEMLRPMLKSWLDDNLPGLVERIVKAEIERVSRGR